MQITHVKVPGAHDLTLDLAVYGDALSRQASEPALLFLHGFGHGACVWRDFATPLAERYRTFALNARGHAGSDRTVCRLDAEPGEDSIALARAIAEGVGPDRAGGSIKSLATDGSPSRWYPDLEAFEDAAREELRG